MRKVAAVALMLAVLVACTRSLSVALPSQTVTVMTYADGKVVERCGFRPGSQKFQKLNQLLQQNSGGLAQTPFGPTSPSSWSWMAMSACIS